MDGTKYVGMDVAEKMFLSSFKFRWQVRDGSGDRDQGSDDPAVLDSPSQFKSEDLGWSQTTLADRKSLSSVFSLAPANP
jgi:hypothetical protein